MSSNNTTSSQSSIDSPPTGKLWKFIVGIGLLLAIPVAIVKITGYNLKDIFISKSGVTSGTVTVLIKSQNDIALPPKGKVYLYYGNTQTGKEINNHKEAIFTGVPSGYFEEGNKVKIRFDDPLGAPYYAVHEDSIYQLKPNQSVELLVALKGLNKLYGITKDFKTGKYIDGARVSVLNLKTFTDEHGWWELEIEDSENQRQFHTLRVSKEGYKNWEQANIPAQTDEEIVVLLKLE